MKIGIIYDMDDVMVDSHGIAIRAGEQTINHYGHSYNELPEEMSARFVGMRVLDIYSEIISYLKMDVSVDEYYKRWAGIQIKKVRSELQTHKGLHTSLVRFKEAGYKIAMATSARDAYIDTVLDKFNIREYFDEIVSGDDVKTGKPDPETYTVAAKKLNIEPSNCIVLEDSNTGITSAKAANCKCIAIPTTSTPKQDHSAADLIVNSLNDVTVEVVEKLVV